MLDARNAVALVLTGCLLAGAAACTDEPDPAPPTGLPATAEGRLVRILGDGTGHVLASPATLPAASVNHPGALAVTPGGSLVGLQGGFPAVFRIDPDDTVTPVPVPDDGVDLGTTPGLGSSAVAAVATDRRFVVAFAPGRLQAIDLDTGSVTADTALPPVGDGAWASSFLRIGAARVLQYGSRWFTVTGLDGGPLRAELRPAPVPGALASTGGASGVLVLTDREIVRLGTRGQVTGRASWTMPTALRGLTATSATGDGDQGLVVTFARPGAFATAESGGVVHVAADGTTTVLAVGSQPPHQPGDACHDSDTPALEAHLAQPLSVVTWRHRLVLADSDCSSLLQLPLP